MAYAIDTLVKAGGDDAHYRLLGAIQTLAESVGWTTLRFDTSIPERELILRSTGTTGEEEITVVAGRFGDDEDPTFELVLHGHHDLTEQDFILAARDG